MTGEELRAYLDMTLAEERTTEMLEQVRRHAATCPACARYLAEATRLEDQLQHLAPIQADGGLLSAVMARVTGEEAAPVTLVQTVGDMLRWPAVLLSALIAAAAWYRGSSAGEWLSRMLTIHIRPPGLGINLLQQPPLVLLLCGVAALLAATAILWDPSRLPAPHRGPSRPS
jgi:anti-sigma factor RsiW